MNTKKLKPGLVAFYKIWPGSGICLYSKKQINKNVNKEKKKVAKLSMQANNLYAPQSTNKFGHITALEAMRGITAGNLIQQ